MSDKSKKAHFAPDAKHRQCRNVVIYGYCKNEDTGCPFNHDGSVKPASAVSSPDRRPLRVDSPSFNPLTFSPGVFTAQHYEHYRSSSQDRLAPPERSGTSSTAASPLVSRTTRQYSDVVAGIAPASSPPLQPQAQPEHARQHAIFNLTRGVEQLGLKDQANGSADAAAPGVENGGSGSGDEVPPESGMFDEDAYIDDPSMMVPPGTYFPLVLSTPSVTAETAQLNHHYYMPGQQQALLSGNKAQRSIQHFFVTDHIRTELTKRSEEAYRPAPADVATALPALVHKYHSLVPLEDASTTAPPKPKPSKVFGYPCVWYKATSNQDGLVYALLRIVGYKLPNETLLSSVVESWRRVNHPNVTRLHEALTTKAFNNESSLILVYDFVPFAAPITAVVHPSKADTTPATVAAAKKKGTTPERHLWSFTIQLLGALKAIHSAGLAVRMLDATKVLVPLSGTSVKNRVRINALGALDFILAVDAARNGAAPALGDTLAQQQDYMHLGHLLVTLANPAKAAASYTMPQLQEALKPCSPAFVNVVHYLLNPAAFKNPDELLAMTAPHVMAELDTMRGQIDRLENELGKELENGRMARLMMKLNFITERPEFNMDHRWSETGDRYLIKLFRDYVFHPVDAHGQPILDVGHVVTCLNKLDAGVPELVMLSSRDERNCLIVSYAELKRCVEDTFQELVAAQALPSY
ncbi:PAB-dependent poly(A)-specific ribonuclease subunit 3 [Allomyces arbusculus]|nr:PAB-dependent poly(A)-specific ribonuclease subunit 3 [Allomyces arbusculus]